METTAELVKRMV